MLAWTCFIAGRIDAADRSREAGHPLLRNYTPREYHAFSSIHAAVQDEQGVMYLGTRACVLEYDGVSWRKIPVGRPTSTTIGLTVEPGTGTIFVGGTDELGYLETALNGEKRFVSLLDRLPAEARSFKDVLRIFATPEGMVFVAGKQIMRWRGGAFRVWQLDSKRAVRTHCVGGRIYVQNKELGLLRLEGDALVPATADPTARLLDIVVMVPRKDGSCLVATYRDGLYTLHDGVFAPIAGNVSDFFKTKLIQAGGQLRDGSLVVGTASAGIIILNEDLTFRDRWDEASGLQNETLWNLFEDRENGLWLCLDVGVTRVETNSAFSVFDASNGLKNQNIYDAARSNGQLVLATATGLYRVVPADPATLSAARCERILGADGFFIEFRAVEEELLVGGTSGVSLLDPTGQLTPVHSPAPPALCMTRSRLHPERVFVGTTTGLDSLRRDANGQWKYEGSVTGVNDQVRSIVEDHHGDLWLGTFNLGLLHWRFAPLPSDGSLPATGEVTSFFRQSGPLANQPWVMVAAGEDNELIAVTKSGMYRWDGTGRNFLPATTYGQRFADGSFQIDQFEPATGGGLWLAGHASRGLDPDQEAGRVVASNARNADGFHALPARVSDKIGKIETITPEEDGTVWIAGPDGMVRLEARRWQDTLAAKPFATLLRRAFATSGDERADNPAPILRTALPYARNSVHFDYAAGTFAPGPAISYQTRLTGLGAGKWSDFSGRTSADYTNLPEGRFVFEVRARSADGQLGGIASQGFEILPPWQRTPWAYLLYVLALIATVATLVWWRGQQFRRRNVALESVIQARTRELQSREAELVRARDDADSANRAKSAFLANMSHEFRTPLNAILGYSQILRKHPGLDGRGREQLAVIGQSGGHLLALINEVLDLSKIEAGRLTLVPSDFSLDQLLDDVCAMFAPRLGEKGLEFRDVRAADLPPVVHADVGRMRQVLFNLLGNAVKFTHHGSVRLAVRLAQDHRVSFEVIDTGVGIAEDQLQEIFLAFHQSGDHQLAAQGTGLGLAISQRLVGLMGGRIQVESALGQGSRFWFDLPLTPAARSDAEASAKIDGTIIGYEGSPRRVLIVDDEIENRRVLRDLLQPLGFEIEEASDGEQCLDMCGQRLPDAVLLDLRLNGSLNGFQVARSLRQRTSGVRMGIIAVSASVFEADRQQAIDAGCDDFIPKPFQEHHLLAVIGRVLQLKWTLAPEPGPPQTGNGAPDQVAASKDEIEALLQLSLRGDIAGIHKSLVALQSGPRADQYDLLIRQLEPLVANYQMDQLHQVLLKLKQDARG